MNIKKLHIITQFILVFNQYQETASKIPDFLQRATNGEQGKISGNLAVGQRLFTKAFA